jgi:DNA-binding IscR family transcriptional regulator
MRETISLLKEISYMQGYALCERSLPESSRGQARELLGCLWRSGLLRIVESSGDDLLCFRYALSRPLQDITLYDVLRVTGGYLRLYTEPDECLNESCGIVGHRLSVMNDMACRFFSEIRLVEVILPEGRYDKMMTE